MDLRGTTRRLIPLAVSLFAAACAHPAPEPAQPERPIDELVEPNPNTAERDLFYGVGGRALVPRADVAYHFVEKKTSGFSDNFVVTDPQGREWNAKFGHEIKAEVAASRLMWAIGFYQEPMYYMKEWRIEGGGEVAGVQPEARFRFHDPHWKKHGEWSWSSNPFVGTREMNGLVVMQIMLNNWDLKTSNNKLYKVNASGMPERVYVVKDIGQSFGRSVRIFLGSAGKTEDFLKQDFIRDVSDDGRVKFDYEPIILNWGLDRGLTVDDVLWTCRRLAKLSDKQWSDAFRAAGYDDAQVSAFVTHMKGKVQEGLALEQRAHS